MVKSFSRIIKKSQSTGMGVGVTHTNTGNEMGGGDYTYPPYSAGRGSGQPSNVNNGDIFDEKMEDYHYIDLEKLKKKIQLLRKAGETEEAERLLKIYDEKKVRQQKAKQNFKIYKESQSAVKELLEKKKYLLKEMFELCHNIGSTEEENRAKLKRIENIKEEIQSVKEEIRNYRGEGSGE